MIAEKGKKQVGRIVSAERGELVTFCGIINAVGQTIPPVFSFPKIWYKEIFLNGAPVEMMEGWRWSCLHVF